MFQKEKIKKKNIEKKIENLNVLLINYYKSKSAGENVILKNKIIEIFNKLETITNNKNYTKENILKILNEWRYYKKVFWSQNNPTLLNKDYRLIIETIFNIVEECFLLKKNKDIIDSLAKLDFNVKYFINKVIEIENQYLEEKESIKKEKEKMIKEIEEKVKVIKQLTQELLDKINKSIEDYKLKLDKYYSYEQKLINKKIFVDLNLFLTKTGLKIIRKLIENNNIIIISDIMLNELEEIENKKLKTENTLERIFYFIKNNIKKEKIILLNENQNQNVDNKNFINIIYKILDEHNDYYFITFNNSLYIKLYTKFKNRILDASSIYKYIKILELIEELEDIKEDIFLNKNISKSSLEYYTREYNLIVNEINSLFND